MTDTAPETGGLRRSLTDAFPLFVAVGLLMAGNGLTSTLLGIRGGLEGFNSAVVGLVLSGYYAGFLVGSLVTPSTIQRVGHVRVFAGLASLASVTVLVHVVRPDPFSWFTLRLLTGLCVSGLFVVAETWLNGAASNATRGGLLASYMVAVTGGMAVGQLLFPVADPGGHAAFVFASVLVSLAVVPVALATVSPPDVPDPSPMSTRDVVDVAPLAVVGAMLSGFAGAAALGGGAVYASATGLRPVETSLVLFAVVAGALVIQVPLGRASDRTDRRRVIAVAGAAGAAAALVAAFVGADRPALLALPMAVAGGVSFPLYAMSSAHLNDYLDEPRVVGAGARMVLLNGVGAIGGPLAAASAIELVGPSGYFEVLLVTYVLIAAYAAYRLTVRGPVPEEDRAQFVALTGGVSPAVALLSEGAVDEVYPPVEGWVELDDGRRMGYVEQGAGTPVLLCTDPGGRTYTWAAAMPAFAADGLRAIVPGLLRRASASRSTEDVLALLRELDLPTVILVGHGRGVGVVTRLAREHPERVQALVLAGAPRRAVPKEIAVPVLRLTGDRLQEDDPELFADLVTDHVRREVDDS